MSQRRQGSAPRTSHDQSGGCTPPESRTPNCGGCTPPESRTPNCGGCTPPESRTPNCGGCTPPESLRENWTAALKSAPMLVCIANAAVETAQLAAKATIVTFISSAPVIFEHASPIEPWVPACKICGLRVKKRQGMPNSLMRLPQRPKTSNPRWDCRPTPKPPES